jgi:hypothetical protein
VDFNFYNKKGSPLGRGNRLDKSNRPSRSILKITEIDKRWIGCGCSSGRSDLSDRSLLNNYKKNEEQPRVPFFIYNIKRLVLV